MTDLLTDELTLVAQIRSASNVTLVGRIGDAEHGTAVVYKPVSGERPLWDFPDGTLAGREVAAHLVSEATGWDVVPRTWLRDGPVGPGMVQLWCEADPAQEAVTLVPAEDLPDGWHHVIDGLDADENLVSLVHEESEALRRMAVFDVLTNNADRKGGHVLEMAGGHRHGIDHGLTFHAEHKLRTVLWGWIGEPLTTEELAGVDRVRGALMGDLGTALAEHVTAEEVEALAARCDRLYDEAVFPAPTGHMPAVPWPPF
ncbi:SCO1664 family protein [Aeromicrobium alkaliterrae]|uniref:SCO1664 family protein n=1 Tax=Aeromicrobium alkaliterrae TaxID=302168 RepID=A0ABN2JGC5_9ACTN